MTFACVLVVKLSSTGHHLAVDDRTLEFTYEGHAVRLKGDKHTIALSRRLTLTAHGFETSESAWEFGQSLKGHLRLVGVRRRMALDVGKQTPMLTVSPQVLKPLHNHGVQVIRPVHGLLVWEQTDNDRFMTAGGGGFLSGTTPDLFVEALNGAQHLEPALDGSRRAIACDLLQAADADTVIRSRFVTAVTALECLIEDMPSSEAAQSVVDQLIATFDNLVVAHPDLRQAELNSLRGRLLLLKTQSIRRQVSELVGEHGPLTDDAVESNSAFVDRCYQYRSALVHGATAPPSDADLHGEYERLRQLVEHLVLTHQG